MAQTKAAAEPQDDEERAKVIEGEVLSVLDLERELQAAQDELSQYEAFTKFIALQKKVQEQSAKTWGTIEEQMIAHSIKSIKGDWGSITIVEKTFYQADLDTLPTKFVKKVADTAKIGASVKLENKLPAGVTEKVTKYLQKRLK